MISMQRICSMLWQVPASAKGRRSLAKPGSMPLTKMLDLPASAASSIGCDQLVGQGACHGYCRNTAPLATTLTPAARMRR